MLHSGEKAYQGREREIVFAQVWPMFDGLHSDPRYHDLMRRVELVQQRGFGYAKKGWVPHPANLKVRV